MSEKTLESTQAYYALWWVARVACICCIVLLLSNITFGAVLWSLFPLKEVRPMLFTTQEKANQVVRIEPIEKGAKGRDLLMENFARQFVMDRETIDCQTEPLRWEKLGFLSSSEIDETFRQQMDPKHPSSPLKQFSEREIKRRVNIISSTNLAPSAPNIWQVDWESIDLETKTGKETRRSWVSTITADCQERAINFANQFANPIGFTVTHYVVSEKKSNP